MTTVQEFDDAVLVEAHRLGRHHLATALALAGTQVLPVTAVSIVMGTGHRQVPVGASDEDAVTAEQWEFTTGDGPCAAARAVGGPVVAREDLLRHHWPVLHDALRRHTPFRSVVALPLDLDATGMVVLYLRGDDPGGAFVLDVARTVATSMRAHLFPTATPAPHPVGARPVPAPEEAGPAWLPQVRSGDRYEVGVAVGMCLQALGLAPRDCLALLRARALVHDLTVDDLARDVTARRVSVESLQP